MMDKKKVNAIFYSELKIHGFKKTANCCYKDCSDLIIMLEVEKVKWSQYFNFFVAIWFKQLGEVEKLSVNYAHFRIGIGDYLLEKIQKNNSAWKLLNIELFYPSIDVLLNLEIPMNEADREEGLRNFIKLTLIPFLKHFETPELMKNLYQTGAISGSFLYYKAAPILGAKLDFVRNEK